MRILLIEDDIKASRLLARGLEEEGFVVDVAHSAESGDEAAFVAHHDLIVLDWMLPGQDGLSLCAALRGRGLHTPILMLTARDALGDRVTGLDAGADDYLTKPFAFEELLARVRALLRRSEMTRPPVLEIGDLSLDPGTQRVVRNVLMRHGGETVSRSRLAEQLWKADLVAIDNLIDSHISNLRRKVDPPGAEPLIQTVRGRGFRIARAGHA